MQNYFWEGLINEESLCEMDKELAMYNRWLDIKKNEIMAQDSNLNDK